MLITIPEDETKPHVIPELPFKTYDSMLFNASLATYATQNINILVNPAGAYTFACWFHMTTASNLEEYMLMNISDENLSDFINMRVSDLTPGPPAFEFNVRAQGTATQSANASPVVPFQQGWHHGVAVQYATNDRHAILDGHIEGINTVDLTPVGLVHVNVGAHVYNNRNNRIDHHDGYICLPAIWNVGLTKGEIKQLSEGVHPTKIRPGNLVALYNSRGIDLISGRNLTFFNGVQSSQFSPPFKNDSYIFPSIDDEKSVMPTKTPELYIHERKPIIGPVEINFTNYPKIKSAYLFNSQSGAKDILDPSTESTPQGTAIVGPFGLKTFNNANDSMYIGTNKLNSICNGAQVVIFHIGFRASFDRASNVILDAYINGATTNSFYIYLTAAGNLTVGGRSQAGEVFEDGVSTGEEFKSGEDHFVEIIYDYVGDKIVAYKDDRTVLNQTVTWDSDTLVAGVSTVQDGLGGTAHRSRNSAMTIYYFAVETYDERPITLNKRSSTRNPYGLLKQSRPDVLIGETQPANGFNIPDAKVEMPSLFIPGRKPIGEMEIDWQNPITYNLELYLPFSNAQPLADLTGKNGDREFVTPYGSPSRHVVSGRECWGFNLAGGATQHISVGEGACRPGSDNFSYGCWVWMDGGISTESINVFMSASAPIDDGDRYGFWGNDSNTTFTAQYHEGGPGNVVELVNSGETPADYENKWVFLLHVLDRNAATPTMYLYRDGILVGSSTDPKISNTAFEDPGFDLKIAAYGDAIPTVESDNRFELRGYISDAYWWRRALTQSEVIELSKNPYQFLVPK